MATTIEPPTVLPENGSYDPYPSPDFAGDVDAAKAEMAQSAYDSDGDGVCDDPVCNDVLFVNRDYDPWTKYSPIMQDALSQIGINLKVRELDVSTAYTTIQTTNNLVPIAINAGWGKDYASPYGFDFFLFNTAGLACEGSVNYSNIGMTEDTASECGDNVLAAYNAAVAANGDIPSVDDDMATCVATPQGDAYNACWATLDQRLMEEIVPWVPYRWGIPERGAGRLRGQLELRPVGWVDGVLARGRRQRPHDAGGRRLAIIPTCRRGPRGPLLLASWRRLRRP